jgi:hypothetical protein
MGDGAGGAGCVGVVAGARHDAVNNANPVTVKAAKKIRGEPAWTG